MDIESGQKAQPSMLQRQFLTFVNNIEEGKMEAEIKKCGRLTVYQRSSEIELPDNRKSLADMAFGAVGNHALVERVRSGTLDTTGTQVQKKICWRFEIEGMAYFMDYDFSLEGNNESLRVGFRKNEKAFCLRGSLYETKCDGYGSFKWDGLIGEDWREMMADHKYIEKDGEIKTLEKPDSHFAEVAFPSEISYRWMLILPDFYDSALANPRLPWSSWFTEMGIRFISSQSL